MKYYKIKYAIGNANPNYWVTRSGTKKNCGFINRIIYEKRAMVFSEDVIKNSVLLRYYLAYYNYELIECSLETEQRSHMIYHTAKDLDEEAYKNKFQTGLTLDTCKYNLNPNVISGLWFSTIENMNYYKLQYNEDDTLWIIYDSNEDGFNIGKYDDGAIFSDNLIHSKVFDVINKYYPCHPVLVNKPWKFSRIYYDIYDI